VFTSAVGDGAIVDDRRRADLREVGRIERHVTDRHIDH